jgi:mannan endo-1,4-beta-mannosidase
MNYKRPLLTILIILTALTGCSSGNSPSHIKRNSPGQPDLAATADTRYVGFSVPDFPPNPNRLLTLERATGTQATAVSVYMSLGKELDTTVISALRSSGILPIVEIDSDKIPLREVATGAEDRTLVAYARQLASIQGIVAVDFDHEFNASWSEWGFKHESPVTFVSAWRHIVAIFRRNGATNVAWIWNPNVSVSSTTAIRPWYPGNSWVTMIGLDGYFFTSKATFGTVFNPTLKQVRAFTRRPVFIVETGINPSSSRATQIENLFKNARQMGIVGVIWFDYHKYKDHDWLLDNDPTALAAFHKAAATFE